MPAPADLVHQTSTSTGTGNLTLSAVNGKRTFSVGFAGVSANLDAFDYFVSNQAAAEWERGTGHLTSGGTVLVRDTVLASSNSNAAVSFSAGTKDVTNDVPAGKQIYTGFNPTIDNIDIIVAELALANADALNVAQFLGASGNRFADSFDATTYVDTGAATNLDTGTAGQIKPTMGSETMVSAATGTIIGNLTDVGSGGNAAAFDGNTSQSSSGGTAATRNNTADDGFIGKDWGSGNSKALSKVIVYAATDASLARNNSNVNTSVTASFDGSNDNSAWTALGTNATGTTSGAQTTITSSSPTTAYRYHRVVIPAPSSSSDKIVAEVQFYLPATANNLTVTSTAFTAASTPTTMKVVAQVEETDSITLNTDLIISVSRDNGTTWTAAVLSDLFTSNSIHVLQSASIDVSGQPSGTSVKWKIVTANNKLAKIHGLYVYWN